MSRSARFAAAALLLLTFVPAHPARALYFAGQPLAVFPIEGGSTAPTFADFNGDGAVDAALGCAFGYRVEIVLGTGSGTFGPVTTFVTPQPVFGLTHADLNGDGRPDLIVSGDFGELETYLNQGSGQFSLRAIYPLLGSQVPLAADFDADGRLDVIALGGTASLFRGNGDGTLAAPVAVGSSGLHAAAGDLNGDGYLDLVTGALAATGTSVYFWNPASGAFGPRSSISQLDGTSANGYALGNLNGDGIIDLVASTDGSGQHIRWLLGAGGGSFGPVNVATLPIDLGPGSVAIVDVNRDGFSDVVTGFNVGVLLGNGAGGLGAPITSYGAGVLPSPEGLVDFDHDGRIDLISAARSTLSCAHGNGDGSFGQNGGWPLMQNQTDVSLKDLDASGTLDAVLSGPHDPHSPSPGGVTILHGNGNGTFGPPTILDSFRTTGEHVVGDFNGDSVLDIAVVQPDFSQIVVYRGTGGGTYAPAQIFPVVSNPAGLAMGDFNADGYPDLATEGARNLDSAYVCVLLGSASGITGSRRDSRFHTLLSSTYPPLRLRAGELNGQPGADLIVVLQSLNGPGPSLVLFNTGAGFFNAGPSLSSETNDVALTDLDGDGILDVFTDDTVYRNDGNGSFSVWTIYAAPSYAYGAVVTADLDGNGTIDLATARDNQLQTYIWTAGNEQKSFGLYNVVTNAGGVAVGDINSDGLPDVVVASDPAKRLTVLLNSPGGEPPPMSTDPGLFAPGAATGEAGGAISLSVSAGDPDGEPIASLTADLSAAPPGGAISFVPNASNTSGLLTWFPPSPCSPFPVVFHASNTGSASATSYLSAAPTGTSATGTVRWSPSSGQQGTYNLTFTGTGAGGATTATTQVTVLSGGLSAPSNAGRLGGWRALSGASESSSAAAPTLTAPATASVNVGGTLAFAVSGSLCSVISLSGAPSGLTFAADREPAVSAPGQLVATPGVPISISVTATDSDGNGIVSLTASYSLPPGNNAAFTANAQQTAGTFTWTPTSSDVGKKFGIVFQAANALVGAASTLIQVQDAPVSYWKLNGNGADEMGRANLAPGSSPSWVAGKLNLATSTNGSGIVGTLTGSAVPEDGIQGPFTFECWFKTSGTATRTEEIIRATSAAGDQSWGFGVTVLGQPVFAVRTGFNVYLLMGSGRVDDTQWHHGAVTYAGGTFQMFVDGQANSAITQSVSVDVAGGAVWLGLGDNAQTFPFSGLVDEIRIWNRTRTQSEIQAAMNSELFQVVSDVAAAESPRATVLGQNFPNPFNPATQIPFQLEREGHARLVVYDVQGRRVRSLVDQDLPAGPHAVRWDGSDDQGRRLASGIYAYRLEAGPKVEVRRMVLVR